MARKAKPKDESVVTPPRGRAEEMYDLAQTLVGQYALRDAMLERLEDYYFLSDDKDPDRETDDEHLININLPHGKDVVDLIQFLLAGAGLSISVPARSDTRADIDLADQAEAWLRALVAENERAAGQGLLDRAGWLVAMRGAFCARVIFRLANLEKDKESGTLHQTGKPAILLQIRDPLVIYPLFGEDGLLYVAESWTRTVADVRATWGQEILADRDIDEEVTWLELWTDHDYCYWAGGEVCRQDVDGANVEGPWDHDYGSTPYVFRFGQQTGVREPERRVRPVLEGERGVIDALDLLDTVAMTTLHEYGGDSLVLKSVRGDDQVQVDLTPLAVNRLRPDESLDWLRAGRQPYEGAGLRARFESAFQRGTFPASMYGADPGRVMAGYALSLLNQSGQMRMRSIVEAIERGMEELLSKALMMAEMMVAPLLDGGVVRAYTRGTTTTRDGRKRTVRQEIGLEAEALKGYYEVDVALGEIMAQDQAQNVVLALRTQQAGPSGRPLLSWRTAVETFKLVDSPSEERLRIDEEMAAQDPGVVALRQAILAAKIREELKEDAAELGVDVEAVLASAQVTPSPRPSPPGGEGAISPGMPGAMVPAEMQGQLPPEAMMAGGMPGAMVPAEMQGQLPPEAMMAGGMPGGGIYGQ